MALLAKIREQSEEDEVAVSQEDERAYLSIVARIYRELRPDAEIRLLDTISSLNGATNYTVDISIRSIQGDVEVLTVLKVCTQRDPISEKDVLDYSTLLSNIGASKGVIICNSGFTRRAKALAPGFGIALSSIQDAQSRKWRDDIKIPVIIVEPKLHISGNSSLNLQDGDRIYTDLKFWLISEDEGKTKTSMEKHFNYLWENNILTHTPGKYQRSFRNKKWKLWTVQRWVPLETFNLEYEVHEEAFLKYFAPLEYRAIQDQLTMDIEVSSLLVKVGPLQIDDTWIHINDLDSFIENNKGILLFFKQVIITFDEFKMENFSMQRKSRGH